MAEKKKKQPKKEKIEDTTKEQSPEQSSSVWDNFWRIRPYEEETTDETKREEQPRFRWI
ncbi:MAG: hypothetical protein IMW92_04305 [Bacillales bacterium]|nr:hypothetical protein [Bacillales bacterium]